MSSIPREKCCRNVKKLSYSDNFYINWIYEEAYHVCT
nr:MAG TPA: Initiation control protein YabA [Caudoviricetes sp.]